MPTEHIVTIKFHMAVDYEPEGGAFSMKEYLLDVGQCITDSLPKEWFEPTEEFLHITRADIQTGTPFFQEGTREEIAQYLKAYVVHEISCRQGSFRVMDHLQHWLEQGLEAFEEGAR